MKQSKYIFTCNAEELCKKKNKREHVTFLCSPNCGYTQHCEKPDIPDRPVQKWKRIGECKRCGKCCSLVTLGKTGHPIFDKIREEVLKEQPNHKCPHLRILRDGTTKCKIYKDRPQFCKEFPADPEDIINIPDCGFSFVEVEDG